MGTVSFVLVALGTVGLVVGEWVAMDRALTLGFAAASLVGLVGVAAQLFGARPRRD